MGSGIKRQSPRITLLGCVALCSLELLAQAWHVKRNALLRGNHAGHAAFSAETNVDDSDDHAGEVNFDIQDVHLAFGDSTETFVFSFSTSFKVEAPAVRISTKVEKNFVIPRSTTGFSSQHNKPIDMVGSRVEMKILAQNEFYEFPPSYKSLYFHHVQLEHLLPSTRYFYQVGNNPMNDVKSQVWSKTFSFKTPSTNTDTDKHHKPKDGNKPLHPSLSFAIVGDLGQTVVSQKTLDMIESRKSRVDGIIIAGDLSYADCDQSRWESWFQMIQNKQVSQSIPMMVAPGNHEVEGRHMCGNNDVKEEFISYRRRFYMPTAQFAEFRNTYYSFDVRGLAHFIILCPYCAYDSQSNQYKWLIDDLKGVDRTKTPWVLVVTHEPFYCSNKAHYKSAEDMRKIYEPVFDQFHVNMVFSGHIHSYERTHPIKDGKRATKESPLDGTVYITVGDGGNREGLAIGFFDEKPEWSAVRERRYGFGELQLTPESLKWIWTCDTESKLEDVVVLHNDLK